ncbi:U1 small nuclear ribonucleoprotein [Grosmannia clavigera kw1407]|uniref:U1 small nuclear ribonucleoprotein n=1 Tax=Grosmannia clavigera (strain kw1407 / UAMH 11150) TaxID=655863 RepID=F0XEZ0_GROCL|nr:U1 small nuclear ribonucleoprotein [Grosmannia clavigera kw1407]EFX03753.1 U1 small nuclear ribonucleoprotein [Grosmannia clavigera kw1407]
MAANAPTATLSGSVYAHNLEERVKPEVLREALQTVFAEFGTVIDIVAKQNLKAKGQAFIVYDDPDAAQTAVREAQGFPLFDKPMVLALARTRSDATVRRSGDEDELEAHKRRRIAERDKKKALEAAEEQKRLLQRTAAGGAGGAAAVAPAVVPDEYLPPNKTLFVQNLPEDCDADVLTGIFGRYEGFREVRLVPGRRLAFVEYDAEPGAITAKENTAGMLVGEADKRPIKVTYQRQ